jgi:hypothetical protein
MSFTRQCCGLLETGACQVVQANLVRNVVHLVEEKAQAIENRLSILGEVMRRNVLSIFSKPGLYSAPLVRDARRNFE